MIKTRKLLALIAGLLLSITASAHHGANSNPALYLAENLIELDGEISRILWRNPHPRLMMTVVTEDGEEQEWELEFSGSVNGWVGDGITAEFWRVGDPVRAAGVISRRDPRSIGLLHLLLPSGEEMVSGNNREMRWSDERYEPPQNEDLQRDPVAIAAAEAAADGIFRVWGSRTSGRPHPEEYAGLLTDYGRELAAQYYGPTDNPELECRTGIPTHMFDPTPMEISDGGDRVHIQTLEYNVERVVYLTDNRPEPVPSNVGYSVGRWDGDTLIVETTHIDWPYFDPYGTPQSDQMNYIETFRVANDDSRLDYTIVATDPVMFAEPVRLARAWRWQPWRQMYEFDCVAEWESSE